MMLLLCLLLTVLGFVSIKKICQTPLSEFHHYSNTLNLIKKCSAGVVFSTFFSVFGYPDETLSLMFDQYITTKADDGLIFIYHVSYFG